MNACARTRPSDAFEALYRENSDPWNFAASGYERSRYAATLVALSRTSYGTAFEPGCSVGELTAELATRCARVIATDIAPTAVARARHRCQNWPHVDIACADLSAGIPDSLFDLVVFSEIGYYFELSDLRTLVATIARQLQPGGEFIAVHWLGHSADHVLHGDMVHELLRQSLPLQWRTGARHAGFRIDSWVRA